MGQKRTPRISKDAWLFSPGYIEVYVNNCNDPDPQWTIDNCGTFVADLYKRRDEIVQEHIREFLTYSELRMTSELNQLREGEDRKFNGGGKLGALDALSYKNYTLHGPGPNANRIYELDNGGGSIAPMIPGK